MSPDNPPTPTEAALRRRLLWVVLGRLGVATLLLGGTLWLNALRGSGFTDFTPTALIGLIIGTYAASGLFAFALQVGWRLRVIAWSQVFVDLLATTMLIYLSGAAGSPFTLLYGIVILAAAITLGPAPARSVAAASLLLYVLIAYSVSTSMVPFPPDQQTTLYTLGPRELGYSLLSNGVALVLVALLAGNLAERLLRAGGRIAEVEASAAALEHLNDDIVRSMTTGLLTIDADGSLQTINPAGAEMFGRAAEQLLGRPLQSFMELPDQADVSRGETTGLRADQSSFPIGFSRTSLRGQDGTLVVFQDLTEIRALQFQARHTERLAALGRLASSLAHEIRNPLGSISGSVQLVHEAKGLEEEDRHLLSIVLKEVERLNGLVSDMLDVSRPTQPSPQDVDAAQLAEELAAVARRDTTLGAVMIEVRTPQSPLHVCIDPNQVRQVLWNLLKNAIQASPRDGVVTLTVERRTDVLVLSVKDEGPGIPEHEQKALFDMFYSKRDHGIGLGLALVKQIVDGSRGEITVTSDENGTNMCVTLPLRLSMATSA